MLHNQNARQWWEPLLSLVAVIINILLGYFGAYSFQCITSCPADDYFAKAIACASGSLTVLLTVPLAIGLNITFRGLPDPPDEPPAEEYQGPVQQPMDDTPPGWLPIKRNQQQVLSTIRPDRVTIHVGNRDVTIKITPDQFRAVAQMLERKPKITYELYRPGGAFTRHNFERLRGELIRLGLVQINRAGETVFDDFTRRAIIEAASTLPY